MISKQERRWVWWFGITVMVLTTLPYLLAFQFQGEDWVFSGFLFGIEDGNSYLAKMMTGYSGDWLFRSSYTTYPQKGLFINLTYLLLGKLTAPPAQHVQMVVLFHLFRMAAGVLACAASYAFIAVFVEDVGLRRWGLAAVTLGGGLGWVTLLVGQPRWLGSLPLDFYSPETFGFLALYGLPHLALARALLLWGIARYIAPQPNPAPKEQVLRLDKRGAGIGLMWLGVGIMQPMTVLVAWGVLGVHLGITLLAALRQRDRGTIEEWYGYFRRGIWAVLVSSPLLMTTVVSFATDDFAKVWTGQNYLPSPHPLHYLLAYGWLLPPVIVGAYRLIRADRWRGWLLTGWMLVVPFWVYAPVNVQRRLAEGVWAALAALACYGLQQVKWKPEMVRTVILIPLMVTSLVLLAGGFSLAVNPAEPVFIPKDEAALYQQLAEEVQTGEVVLASYESSNRLPAWAPLKVLIGHGPESINREKMQEKVGEFYQAGTDDGWREGFLDLYRISYVVWGARERQLGEWDPAGSPILELVTTVGDTSVYRVLLP